MEGHFGLTQFNVWPKPRRLWLIVIVTMEETNVFAHSHCTVRIDQHGVASTVCR